MVKLNSVIVWGTIWGPHVWRAANSDPEPRATHEAVQWVGRGQLPIWRRLSIPGDVPLETLHWVIQAAFGWENDHLHEFEAKGRRYADHGYRSVPGTEDERRATLAAVAPRKGDRLRYTYDFGDNWVHDIAVEAVEPAEAEPRVVCLAAENAGPPEDCGGIPGYYNLLEAIADPRHPEHDHYLDWLGDEPLDPTAVDRDTINKALGTIRIP